MTRVYSTAIILTLFLICTVNSQVQLINGTIKVTVGTTAGCGDTVVLIPQLGQVYEKYRQFLELEFVPWGRTRRDENGNLVCQFLENDCFGNRLHRCALDLLKGNQDAQMNYMNCEFTTRAAFLNRSLLCAQAVGLSLIEMDYCLSTTGDALEGPASQISEQPMAIIHFVPFIVFNDNIDILQHNQARERLESVICFALAADPSTGVTHCKI